MAAETTTRGDRRRERTRARLVDAARELISEHGVGGLKIAEITERADVALGSFYNHFESKEELVDAVVSDSVGALAEMVSHASYEDQDPAEIVAFAIKRFVRLAYDDPPLAQLLVELNHADALFMHATDPYARVAVEAGVASGRLREGDAQVIRIGVIGASLAVMRAVVEGRLGEGADVALAEASLLVYGLSVDEAAEIARRPLPDQG